jgi:hypothetical protein
MGIRPGASELTPKYQTARRLALPGGSWCLSFCVDQSSFLMPKNCSSSMNRLMKSR